MFKYFVRYQYSTYQRLSSDSFDENYYKTESVDIVDSCIITSVYEFTDMNQVRDALKHLTHTDEYYDIVAMNRL